MYPSGQPMYQHPRMTAMGQTEASPAPSSIPIHYPMGNTSQGNMGMQGPPMSDNHVNYTHKTHLSRIPDHNPQQHSTNHNQQQHTTHDDPQQHSTNCEPQQHSTNHEPHQHSTDHDPQQHSTDHDPHQHTTHLDQEQYSTQLPGRKEVAGEGSENDASLIKAEAHLPNDGNNGSQSPVSEEEIVKTEREEEIDNFMETAHDTFVQISNNELKIKEAADLLGRPYSFVYSRYQEYCVSTSGKVSVTNIKKGTQLKKNGKKKRRPKRLTMKKDYRPKSTGEIFQCEDCPAVFNTARAIRLHSKLHKTNNKKSHPCTACGIVFPRITLMMAHRLEVHEEALQCPHCEKTYVHIDSYKFHIKTHSSVRPFVCDECGKGFFTRFYLESHYRLHTGERPFMCGFCQKTFGTIKILKAHLLVHTGREELKKPFACPHCDKRYTSNHDLDQHVNIHTGAKPYECDQCDERFNFKAGLNRHLMTHTGVKPFKCDYCPADFYLKSDLRLHSMAHTGNKPFKCDLCDYSCTRKHILEYHKNTHTGERPFKCDFYGCSAEYSRPSTLKTHKEKHGPPPLKTCKVCNEKFPDLNSLKLHMMIHPGNKPVQCEQCDKIFYNESTLKRHMHTHMYKPPGNKIKQVRHRNRNPGIKNKRVEKSGITEQQMISQYQAVTAAENGYNTLAQSLLNKRVEKPGITEKQMIPQYQATTAAENAYNTPFNTLAQSILHYQY